jgi:hypothetical protein
MPHYRTAEDEVEDEVEVEVEVEVMSSIDKATG